MRTQQELLDELARTIRTHAEDAEAFKELVETQLLWKPSAERWSVAQCLKHLTITDTLYFDRLEIALGVAAKSAAAASQVHKTTFTGRYFVKFFGEGLRWRVKAPGTFEPDNDARAATLFLAHQERFDAIIGRAREVNTNAVRVASPLTGLIRFRMGECLDFLVSHQARHLRQARLVLDHPGMPQNGASA